MANPRHWEHGEGKVSLLTPDFHDFAMYMQKAIDLDEYKKRFIERLRKGKAQLAPGTLGFVKPGVKRPIHVVSGDTLCCACSRLASVEGRCHRRWIVRFLKDAGWDVVIDGVFEEGKEKMNDQGHIDELKAQIEDLQCWLDDARETLARTRENNKVQLDKLHDENREAYRKINEKDELIKKLRNGRDDFKRVSEEKKKELEKLRNMMATKDGQIGSLRNDKVNLESELEAANKKIEDLQKFAEDSTMFGAGEAFQR